MTRNHDILRIFEIGDDSLQGVFGYHFYLNALHRVADPIKVKEYLPTTSNGEAFPHTFSWDRYYCKDELIDSFKTPLFELYQSRITLANIASIFDDSLYKFVKKLESLELTLKIKDDARYYKDRLEWALQESRKCTIGDETARGRLGKTFGIIDEVRILRNLIMHNHGIFDKEYEDKRKRLKTVEVFIHPYYTKYKNSGKSIAIILNHQDIINCSRAHIEVLHILHNQLQKEYFHHPEVYEYAKENKIVNWKSAFWGNADMNLDLGDIEREPYLKI